MNNVTNINYLQADTRLSDRDSVLESQIKNPDKQNQVYRPPTITVGAKHSFPLWQIVKDVEPDSLIKMIKESKPDDVNTPNNNGFTPVPAAYNGHVDAFGTTGQEKLGANY